jgi:hypothetical protein
MHVRNQAVPLTILGFAVVGVVFTTQSFWRSADDRLILRMIAETPALIEQLPKDVKPRQPAELREWFAALTKAGYDRDADRLASAIQDPTLRSYALAAEAHGFFSAQRMKEAERVAQRIPDQSIRDETLRVVSIGFAFHELGNGSVGARALGFGGSSGMRAVDTASSVQGSQHRSQGLVDTARVLRIARDDSAADAAAERVTDQTSRDQAHADRAWALALRRQPRAAILAADSIKDLSHRVHALVSVADHLADRSRVVSMDAGVPAEDLASGEIPASPAALRQGAIDAVDRALAVIDQSGIRASASLPALVTVLGRTGQINRATELAERIKQSEAQGRALESVVEAVVRESKGDEAQRVARLIRDPKSRVSALTKILAAGNKKGITSEMLAAARELSETSERAYAFNEISRALAKAGLTAQAVAVAGEAIQLAPRIADPETRAYVLAGAAGARAEAQPGAESSAYARRALEASAPIASPYYDGGPLQAAARALLRAAGDDGAVAVGASIEDPKARALSLTALADILGGFSWDKRTVPATQAAEAALKAAASVRDPNERVSTIGTVVEIVARADRVAEALAAARTIPESRRTERSLALRQIAALQAERTRYEDAWKLAQACLPRDKLAVYAMIVETRGEKVEWKRRFSNRRLQKATAPANPSPPTIRG